MKKIIITLILIFNVIVLFSQSYLPIKTDGDYLFVDINDQVRAIRIDSVVVNGNDYYYYNFCNLRENDTLPGCFNPYGSSWIGKYIIFKPDGYVVFFNINN